MRYTKEDFEKFREVASWWLEAFGLTDFEARFSFIKLDACYACAEYDVTSRDVVFKLNKGKVDNNPYATAARCALHEVMHVLLADLNNKACARNFNEDAYMVDEHKVINRIMNVLTEQNKVD